MDKKGRNRSGSLYRRWDGKEYAIKDKRALGKGVVWIRYMVAGKTLKQSLGTADIDEAVQKKKEIMAPLIYADETEALTQLTLRVSQSQQKQDRVTQEQTPPLTIVDAWAAYLQSNERPDSGERSLSNYAAHWTRFSRWLKKTEPAAQYLREVTSKNAQDYATDLTRAKYSPNTYNKHVSFLRLLFRVLAEPARMQNNPFDRLRTKQLKTNVRRELTIAELKDILETAKDELQTLLYIGTFTGLRLGDCATLKWGEVDLDRKLIRRIPNKTASKKQKPVLIGIPEVLHAKLADTPSSKRKGYVIPKYATLYTFRNAKGEPARMNEISKEVQALLIACEIQTTKEGTGKEEHEKAVKQWEDGGQKGQKPVYKRAVVEVGFHSLRHTYVSLHAERGTAQAVIQANVGHGSPSMTAHYTHIGEDAARQAATALDYGIIDAEYEVIKEAPLPKPVVEKLTSMTADNWEQIRDEMLRNNVCNSVPKEFVRLS